MIMYDLHIPFFKVCDSGKFPELVWLVVNCRQTIFSLLGQLGFLERNHLPKIVTHSLFDQL